MVTIVSPVLIAACMEFAAKVLMELVSASAFMDG